MVAYNFQSRFASLIESGVKRQTIRALGSRRHASAGELLQLYTGQRTKHCRKLLEAECLSVQAIEISPGGGIYLDDEWLHPSRAFGLAKQDGFENLDEFMVFFADRLPFEGLLIRW